jgi:hypothetical protein
MSQEMQRNARICSKLTFSNRHTDTSRDRSTNLSRKFSSTSCKFRKNMTRLFLFEKRTTSSFSAKDRTVIISVDGARRDVMSTYNTPRNSRIPDSITTTVCLMSELNFNCSEIYYSTYSKYDLQVTCRFIAYARLSRFYDK